MRRHGCVVRVDGAVAVVDGDVVEEDAAKGDVRAATVTAAAGPARVDVGVGVPYAISTVAVQRLLVADSLDVGVAVQRCEAADDVRVGRVGRGSRFAARGWG